MIHNATNATAANRTTVVDGEAARQFEAGEVLGNSTYLEPGVHEEVTVRLN